MKMFRVIVDPTKITVIRESKLSAVHYRANVDGEPVNYQIVSGDSKDLAGGQINRNWFDRGSNHVMYHARNLGENVRWLNISKKKSKSKKKVSNKQRILL
jgi:hypothetical protein